MSRPGSSMQRPLSTTEELEKLEQSITLTLQEIDHNFSKAHRIVTTSILPLVEQYGEHSRAVWDASKFWKQFFEASANVSLSGYEELANDDDTTAAEETTVHDETTADYTPRPHHAAGPGGDQTPRDQTASYHTGRHGGEGDGDGDEEEEESSLFTDNDGDLSGSTPRPPAAKTLKPQFADLDSPYENLKRRIASENNDDDGDTTTQQAGSADSSALRDEDESELLAQHTARLPDMSMTPRPSLGQAAAALGADSSAARPHKDPLLHRVLDKNYRLQATPHKPMSHGVSPIKWKVTEKPAAAADRDRGREAAGVPSWRRGDDSPPSSPEMEAPRLRSEAFMSPVRAAYRRPAMPAPQATGPRTPGVSVQTPATGGRKTRDFFQAEREQHEQQQRSTGKGKGKAKDRDEITWESDSEEESEDLYGGMSPPKTIQFALPASKLLQTPAREASKRIVDDILLTAGAEPEESSEYSPTMVKMNENILDDTF